MKRAACLMMILLTVPSWALPPYARLYKEKYGVMPHCAACHNLQNWRMNDFGEAFDDKGRDLAAFDALDVKDSDGDGVDNGAEARAGSNPGDPASTPKRPGEWLKDVSIRPPAKPLAQAFPGATAEVSFPEWSGETKASLVTWGDEALFPVVFTAKGADGKPVGRAVYVSAQGQGPRPPEVMLLVLADAAGAVAGVKVLHQHGSEAVKADAYLNQYKGKTLDTLGGGPPAPAGAAEDARVLAFGVRKALTILKDAAK